MTALAWLLIVVGLGWASLGVVNLFLGFARLSEQGFGDTAKAFALIFNMFVLILPGLGVAGVGAMTRGRARRSEATKTTDMPHQQTAPPSAQATTKTCPQCAEQVKLEAIICRYCRHQFGPQHVDIPAILAERQAMTKLNDACGHMNLPDSRFCTKCGTPVGMPPAVRTVAKSSTPARRPLGMGTARPGLAIVGMIAGMLFLALLLHFVWPERPPSERAVPTAQDPVPVTPQRETPPPSVTTITKSMYDLVATGMARERVDEIIGRTGEELNRSELAGITTVMYMWQNRDGSNMNVLFQNERVVLKAQFGLK